MVGEEELKTERKKKEVLEPRRKGTHEERKKY